VMCAHVFTIVHRLQSQCRTGACFLGFDPDARARRRPLCAAAVGRKAFYAYCWALLHAEALGTTAENVVCVGDSAGGNLAAHIGIRCAEVPLPPPPPLLLAWSAGATAVGLARKANLSNGRMPSAQSPLRCCPCRADRRTVCV